MEKTGMECNELLCPSRISSLLKGSNTDERSQGYGTNQQNPIICISSSLFYENENGQRNKIITFQTRFCISSKHGQD
eukprot:scaffold15910_cov193-Amphora_coffeaeformis.AAC.13